MKINIDFTDDELRRIVDSSHPDADVIFADGFELPDGYPPCEGPQAARAAAEKEA